MGPIVYLFAEGRKLSAGHCKFGILSFGAAVMFADAPCEKASGTSPPSPQNQAPRAAIDGETSE